MGFLSRLFGLDSKKDVELEAAAQPVEPETPMVRVKTQLRMETRLSNGLPAREIVVLHQYHLSG